MVDSQRGTHAMMKLYQYEDCGYCRMVRRVMSDLLLTYVTVNVPQPRHLRHEVFEASGQYLVPVLVDEDVVLDDEETIIAYLKQKYARGA